MKKSLGPQAILHPHPVLIVGTYNQDNKANIMTASWGGICCSEPPCIAIALRKATDTYKNIFLKRCFTIGIPSSEQAEIADYVGMVSGKSINKFIKTNLTPVKSKTIDAPYVEEFSYSLECSLLHTIDLGLHTQFIGQIVNVIADENVLGEKGLPDIEKTQPLIYGSQGSSFYYSLGQRIGKGFSLGNSIKDR